MFVEENLGEMDQKLDIFLGNLRKIIRKLEILRQIRDAPEVYACAVVEVVRRRKFSRKFLEVSRSCLRKAAGSCFHEELQMYQQVHPVVPCVRHLKNVVTWLCCCSGPESSPESAKRSTTRR